MAKLVRSEAGSGSAHALLARILERSELVAAVERLSAPVLGRLIEHVGLEDAGELVAAASTQQLERVWDRDLWAREPGDVREHFDPERFATWLAVMLEAGEAQTARRLRELPFDLLTLAVHRLVRVVDRGTWSRLDERELEDDDDEGGGLHAPWHELVVIARDHESWDAVWTALLALDEEDHVLLRRVLERCCDLDLEGDPWDGDDDGGLGERSDDATLEREVAAERDTRQAGSGWLAASDARGFLLLARADAGARAAELERDATTRAYFRELDSEGDPQTVTRESAREPDPEREHPVTAQHGDAELLGMLAESGVLGALASPALAALPAGTAVEHTPEREPEHEAATALHAALRELEREDPLLWAQRMEELGYLANVVLAGTLADGRAPSPRDALEAAAAVCSLGLELQLPARAAARTPVLLDALRAASADRLFRAGYGALHRELVQPAWRLLALRVGRYGDAALRAQLREAERVEDPGALAGALDPELLRMRAERLDALCGLARAIPVLAGALAAPGARFVSTRVQLRAARRLLRALVPRATRATREVRRTGS